jgi:hypothetical protein
VELALSQADPLDLVACRIVCTTWMHFSPPLHDPRREAEQDCSKLSAAKGWLDVLPWARANGCPWEESTCANAAKGGHLKVLQWARTNGCPWD